MGTTSARAACGSPLTMLWLLLWTINCCYFLFPPLSFSLSLTIFLLGLASPCTMTTFLPFELGKLTMRYERRESWLSRPNCVTQIWKKRSPGQGYSERGQRNDKNMSRNRTTMSLASSLNLHHRLPKNQMAVYISKDVFTCWDKKMGS